MAKKRLSDTAAIAGPMSEGGDYSSRSVSVEKIDNGFLIRESTCDGKGNYSSSCEYSEKRPSLDAEPRGQRQLGAGSLREAMESLKE